jgi:hypothetical protein
MDTKTIKQFNQISKLTGESDLRSLLSVDNDVFAYIQNKLEPLKELFHNYSLIGDKLSFNRMNVSSFRKFLKDCDVLMHRPKRSSSIITGKGQNSSPHRRVNSSNKSKAFSKSPNKITSPEKNKSPNRSINIPKTKTNVNLNPNTNKYVNVTTGGKFTESDAHIIFFTLTGPRNFDNSAKIKSQFDKNSGYLGFFDDNLSQGKSVYFDKTFNMKINKETAMLKMDFFLFVKSFELIASRLYPRFNLNKAVYDLFEKVEILFYLFFRKLVNC